jgi:Mn2+/Fe2+ NRAMP family transporter
MKRLLSVLLWSAISAAFIGPGTVTTASSAGANFEFSLLWALVFSVIACLVLQEASARLTIASGKPLARAMAEVFHGRRSRSLVPAAAVTAVVLGCAAYQAGNILGAAAGASLNLNTSPRLISLVTGCLAAMILSAGTAQRVAQILGVIVALMGAAFLTCAIRIGPDTGLVLKGSLVPTLPSGSGMLALGLIGTTVVPYNLFLGSGLARGQTLRQARLGLLVAIPLGGIISMGIVVAGSAVEGPFSFQALSETLQMNLGNWAGWFFGFGLFFAGLSSAITAPLAAALSVQGFRVDESRPARQDRCRTYRSVWGGVLVFGLGFGLIGVKPIPVILLAQALNGVLLPLVAALLWIAVNDVRLMGRKYVSGTWANFLLGFSTMAAMLLGTSGVLRAGYSVVGREAPRETVLLITAGVITAVLVVPILRTIRARRSPDPD